MFLISFGAFAQNNRVNWLSFEELEQELIKEPKKVLIEFYADWCVYCKKMEQSVFSKPEIKKMLGEDYYAVRFNVETNDTIRFGGNRFINKNWGKRRNAFHEIPELLAGRQDKPLELPATVILNENFEITNRYYRYISPKEMLSILKE
ncbi:MAG: DUF255 domain-containing protein [Winogradskyella sp.]|nr:MAG: DUF255 domain-containing protein [Winogradskyella sp.]